ncbi:MAG: hypothetical protein BWK80_57655 [Desulfobacteraceae bacterium IS3]|nr:MAG: hypothetical protein BWK80_57655 [Desulfobacteraceae bacterium IS3]
MKTKQRVIGMVVVCFAAMVFAVNGFGAVPGDVDGSGKIDLKDVINAIQICAGISPTSAVHAENNADGDGKIGLADAIFALAAVPSLTVTQKAEVGYYTAGQELTVIADIVYTGGVSGMGGTLDLPDTWEYVSMDGDMPTDVELLANGDLRFYWVGVPASPVSFTYKVKVPAGTTGNYPIDMQIRYLHRGKEETPVYSSLWIDSYIPPVPITTYCITVTSEGNGKITPAGSTADKCYAVPESEKVTFTMTPVDGFAVKDVLVDGVSVGAVTSYTFEKVAAKHTVHAKFTSGKIRATWTPAEGGKILVEGLTAKMIPNEGYTLEDVKVNGVSVGSVLTYTFDETCSDTAGRSTGAIAKIEKDCWWPGACDNDCWWPGACDNPIPVTCTIFAIFKAKGNYTITVTAGNNGTVTPPGTVSVLQGADQKFEIKANNGYYVANVLVDGESVGARANYTFEDVDANHTLDAKFTDVCGNIATSGFNGKIVLQGLKAIIVPNTGYEVEDVRVNGISRGSVPTYTLPECEEEPPAEECCYSVIHATFKKSAITVTVVEPENGFAIVTVNPDGTRKLTIIPDEGYSVKDVTLDGISVGKVLTYDFPAGDTAHAVVVTLVTGVPQ